MSETAPRNWRRNVDEDIAKEEKQLREDEYRVERDQRTRRLFGGGPEKRGLGNFGRSDAEMESSRQALQRSRQALDKSRQHKEAEGYKAGGWIKGAIKKPGALRSQMGVKAGQKIPAKKLATAAKAPGKLGQRARLAQTLSKMKKK